MAETKRYDVGGMDRGNGKEYPAGTTLKLTKGQADAMGLTDKNVSKMTTTADDLTKRDRYEDAMTSQDRMRAEESAPADDAGTAKTKKRAAPAAADEAK